MRAKEVLLPLMALALLISGCTQEEPSAQVVVAGKTVYQGMGIEGAIVSAQRQGQSTAADETLSTYHGSFMLHLSPGRYTLKSTALVPRGADDISVSGAVDGVVVEGERVDRITIEMDGENADD